MRVADLEHPPLNASLDTDARREDDNRIARDHDGADVWLRIIVAIGTLGEPPTEARH